jgi:hypothetical protein
MRALRVERIPSQHAADEPRLVSGNKLTVMAISGRTIFKLRVIKNLMTEEHLDPKRTTAASTRPAPAPLPVVHSP